jgi:RNA polymerase sigma-70 factor (ECF subfamily)
VIDLDVFLPGIAAGAEEAFTGWLAGAEGPLRRSLGRFAASVDTEAMLQETLLRIWQVAGRCQPDGQPNSLLRFASRIARNLALDEIRRRRVAIPGAGGGGANGPGAGGHGADGPAVDPVDPEPPPDPILRGLIRGCLERLRGAPRRALLLRIESAGGESDHKLAPRLKMRLNTFLQNVTRARRQVALCLERSGVRVPS